MVTVLSMLHGSKPIIALLALALILLEYLFHKLNHDEAYDVRESATSLFIAVGNKVIGYLTGGIVAVPMLFVYQHRLFTMPLGSGWAWVTLFFCVEFSYYVHHVAMHRVSWLWASHAVHHSPTRLNLSAAVRLGWGGNISGGFLFYLPLVALGFHPLAVVAMLGLGLLYQFLLHVAHPPHLGALERVLNTPRHHRVHHAANAACLDKNFGLVLIVFDRLFGTFASAPKDEVLRFGVAGAAPSANPLRVVFGVWLKILSDAWQARGLGARMRALFGAPH